LEYVGARSMLGHATRTNLMIY